MIDVAAPLLLVAVAVAYARRVSTLAAPRPPGGRSGARSRSPPGSCSCSLADLPPLSTIADELVVAHMASTC